jgi:membrane-bound serine protease (ClpP class)
MRKLLFFFLVFASIIGAQERLVYKIIIDEEIGLGLTPYITRGIKEAEEAGAEAIIFRINTFGGRVDAATQIKDLILSSKIPTIAYINNRAVSAGALIAISCKHIVMAPGSMIGAATVVDQTGQKVGEKYQSYMRSEMRATAERNGRRSDIAQGMVDERVIVEGLADSTQLISLTSEEALKYEMTDFIEADIEGVLKQFDLTGAEIVTVEPNWAENIVTFLNNGIVSSILLMIGFFGLFAEVKTPGWGVPGTAGIIALALFFGSSYILDLASMMEIILFILGISLLAVEIFVIPGFGIAGIGGILLILVSLFMALISTDPFLDMEDVSMAIVQLTVALVGAIILILLLAKFLPKSKRFSTLVLSEEESAEKGFVSHESEKEIIGMEGVALTTLRPSGSAEINGKRYDVVAEWDYVEAGKRIVVLKVEGIKVVVKEVKSE